MLQWPISFTTCIVIIKLRSLQAALGLYAIMNALSRAFNQVLLQLGFEIDTWGREFFR